MAELNLLKAGYQGKLGETNGYEHKGKFIVRATPFSRSPLNKQQKENFNAFTKLNRLAGFLSRNCFEVFNIKNYPAYKHNAIASLLKPALNNGNFDLSKIKDLQKTFNATFDVNWLSLDPNIPLVLNVQVTNWDSLPEDKTLVLAVFTDNYKGLAFVDGTLSSITIDLNIKPAIYPEINILTFAYYKENGLYMKSNIYSETLATS